MLPKPKEFHTFPRVWSQNPFPALIILKKYPRFANPALCKSRIAVRAWRGHWHPLSGDVPKRFNFQYFLCLCSRNQRNSIFFPGYGAKIHSRHNNTKERSTFANPALLLGLGAATGLLFRGMSRNLIISILCLCPRNQSNSIFFHGYGAKIHSRH